MEYTNYFHQKGEIMKKPLRIILIVLGALIAFVAVFLLAVRLYFRLPVSDYYKASEKGFVIPGTGDGFIAQGIEYDTVNNYFIVTGYMKDGSASPVYLVDRSTGKLVKTILPQDHEGNDYTGHAGGISLFANKFLYIADGGGRCLRVYNYADVLAAEDGAHVRAIGKFSTKKSSDDNIRPSFTTVIGDKLIIGEFYRAGNYETPESHTVNTTAGDTNKGLAVVYQLNEDAVMGADMAPLYAFSLPDKVQGIYMDGNTVYISTSYGPSFSYIYTYDATKTREADITVLGYTIPLYALDSSSLLSTKKIPPMSEELVIVDGRLYVMCESASNKYIFGKFTSAKWCYGTELDFFK